MNDFVENNNNDIITNGFVLKDSININIDYIKNLNKSKYELAIYGKKHCIHNIETVFMA